ncbi:hypothetical protein DFH07DRAFT_772098 [Mycena maculata]|uniref:Uncharacterized protein n=1 Tax=Mycena maculata TaxID=230809 RepID=A0AAD7NGH1_9AGAR|nr:hypothetical protein DFH07DRAFT_772098 [Mycena maculata]
MRAKPGERFVVVIPKAILRAHCDQDDWAGRVRVRERPDGSGQSEDVREYGIRLTEVVILLLDVEKIPPCPVTGEEAWEEAFRENGEIRGEGLVAFGGDVGSIAEHHAALTRRCGPNRDCGVDGQYIRQSCANLIHMATYGLQNGNVERDEAEKIRLEKLLNCSTVACAVNNHVRIGVRCEALVNSTPRDHVLALASNESHRHDKAHQSNRRKLSSTGNRANCVKKSSAVLFKLNSTGDFWYTLDETQRLIVTSKSTQQWPWIIMDPPHMRRLFPGVAAFRGVGEYIQQQHHPEHNSGLSACGIPLQDVNIRSDVSYFDRKSKSSTMLEALANFVPDPNCECGAPQTHLAHATPKLLLYQWIHHRGSTPINSTYAPPIQSNDPSVRPIFTNISESNGDGKGRPDHED